MNDESKALDRLAAAVHRLLNEDPHDLLDKRPCPTCRELRAALDEAHGAQKARTAE